MVWQALENMLGDSVFASSMKSFAESYRFRHPDGEDFIESISESSSRDLTKFVEMFIEGTSRVDYAVEKLRFEKVESDDDSVETEYTVYVDVTRKRDGILPQVVTVGLKDGMTVEKAWDGVDRVRELIFETESIPVYASIDKKISYEIDENLNNNTIYLDGHIARLISFEWDVIFVIEFLASILL
jgi:aminopeptidase N